VTYFDQNLTSTVVVSGGGHIDRRWMQNDARIHGCNVKKSKEERQWPPQSLALGAVGRTQLIQCIHSAFRTIVEQNYMSGFPQSDT